MLILSFFLGNVFKLFAHNSYQFKDADFNKEYGRGPIDSFVL